MTQAKRVEEEPADMAAALGGVLGSSQEQQRWLETLFQIFPIPRVQHAHHLIFAVQRLVTAAPWISAGMGGHAFEGPLESVAHAIRAEHASGRLMQASQTDFSGDFLRTRTLLSQKARPLAYLEVLRGTVLVCAWRWAERGEPRVSALGDLTGAVRRLASDVEGVGQRDIGSQGKRRAAPKELLDVEFLSRLSAMKGLGKPGLPGEARFGPESFRSTWNEHVLPELRSFLGRIGGDELGGPGGLEQGGEPSPGGGRPGGLRDRAKKNKPFEDPELVRQRNRYRRRLAPPVLPGGELEPGESPEEILAPVDLVPALSVPSNPDAAQVAEYQVRQAIWGLNGLLLPNHPTVLDQGTLAKVVVETLRLLRSSTPALRLGLLALLLEGLTGRAPRSLASLRVLGDGSSRHEPTKFDLLLRDGELRFSVFWQVAWTEEAAPSYFKPSSEQREMLEEVGSTYQLPLVPPVVEALLQGQHELRRLTSLTVPEIEREVRAAALVVGGRLGMSFTPGQVRASFAAHLFESCRDLALTQLLCADSFGQSTAPLSYYAPPVKRLRETFWKYQASLIGEADVVFRSPPPSTRVGSLLQVRKKFAVKMARSFGAPMREGVARLRESGQGHIVHSAITLHLLGILVAGLTHRPTSALFELRRSDFFVDGEAGSALFRDKIVDGAHDPRLVALPPLACRQFEAYLRHLEALKKIAPAIASHIKMVLEGGEPLFFLWDGGKEIGQLDLKRWKEQLPDVWRRLPRNWGRHWCRTRAIDLGLPPELVNIQMGHLEAVGYPFSGVSPTVPEEFVSALAPKWEAVLRSQGWQLVNGFAADTTCAETVLPPLRTWREQARRHAELQSEAALKWRATLDSRRKGLQQVAREAVLAHPQLVSSGISALYRDNATSHVTHGLTREDFERLRDEFLDDDSDELAMRLAKADSLCRIARKVNRLTGKTTHDPAGIYLPRRPLDNALFPGMMTALSQVLQLRAHVAAWSGLHKPGPRGDFALACARVTLALTLFGFCEDEAQISGAISRRTKAQRSAKFRDLLLVPYGDEPHEVLAIRGVAAIAFAQVASRYPTGCFPGWGAVAPRLEELLPDWARPKTPHRGDGCPEIVAALCETIAVSNRYELSSAARLALGPDQLCTPARVEEQIALVDGDPPGFLDRRQSAEAGEIPSIGAMQADRWMTSKGAARTQYLSLCAVFPEPGLDVRLPLTGHVIPSGQGADGRHRKAIVAEIDAMLEQSAPEKVLQPVVRLLASWVRDMLLHGTERRKVAALGTVETYLTRIGGVLVHVMGHRNPTKIDEDELEQAYLAAVESKMHPALAAAAALALHRFGQRTLGLPEIDQTGLESHLYGHSIRRSDARLVLPSEREATIDLLSELAEGRGTKVDPGDLRNYRQARIFAELIADTGARRSEILGLEVRDVSVAAEGVAVRIRNNISRRLKTPSARRHLRARSRGASQNRWLEAERRRFPAGVSDSAYLFAPVHRPRGADGREDIAAACMEALKEVTQSNDARLHHLRHLRAMETVTSVFLTESDRARLIDAMDLAPTPTWTEGIALPRDLRAQVSVLGHANPQTTLQWYHHAPFLLRSRPDEEITLRYAEVGVIATLAGITRDGAKSALRGHPGTSPAGRTFKWLDRRLKPRQPPSPRRKEPTSGVQQPPSEPQKWSAQQMARLIKASNRSGDLEQAWLSSGGAPDRTDALRARIVSLESRIGRKLVEDGELNKVKGRPKRRIRPMREALPLESWWEEIDTHSELADQLISVAEAIGLHMVRDDNDWVRLPVDRLPSFKELLQKAGISADLVTAEELGSGLVRIRVRRVGSGAPSQAGIRAAQAGAFLGYSIKRLFAVILLSQDPI